MSSQYWSRSYRHSAEGSARHAEQLEFEAQILGYQFLLDGMIQDLRVLVHAPQDRDEINRLYTSLIGHLTGGTFSERGRGQDTDRCKEVVSSAALLAMKVRRFHRSSLPFATFIAQYHANMELPPLGSDHLRRKP